MRTIVPIRPALECGVDEIVVIAMSPPPRPRLAQHYDEVTSAVEVLMRTIEAFTSQNTANDIAFAQAMVDAERYVEGLGATLKSYQLPDEQIEAVVSKYRPFPNVRAPRMVVIRPEHELPGDSLTNTIPDQQRMFLIGEDTARAVRASNPPSQLA